MFEERTIRADPVAEGDVEIDEQGGGGIAAICDPGKTAFLKICVRVILHDSFIECGGVPYGRLVVMRLQSNSRASSALDLVMRLGDCLARAAVISETLAEILSTCSPMIGNAAWSGWLFA